MFKIKKNIFKSYVGNIDIKISSNFLFEKSICEFLDELSKKIISDREAKKFSDLISFAFWCRKSNIDLISSNFKEKNLRVGRGLIFHIAPSNVPINFAFSFVFGLLSGNCNVVRVPSKPFKQVDILFRVLKNILKKKKFKNIKKNNLLIKYERNDFITKHFSSICSVRIIWGGDNTINEIRKFSILPSSFDITFADRYSFTMINSDKIIKLNSNNLKILSERFYNDTFLVDQNACSSPHLVYWVGKNIKDGKKIFWKSFNFIVEKQYHLEKKGIFDKFAHLQEDFLELKNFKKVYTHKNYVYRINLNKIDKNIEKLRGKWGYFYEYDSKNINEIFNYISPKYQTLSYFGFEKDYLINLIKKKKLLGIDRVVPIGETLNIGMIWDGFDLAKVLSRVIEIK